MIEWFPLTVFTGIQLQMPSLRLFGRYVTVLMHTLWLVETVYNYIADGPSNPQLGITNCFVNLGSDHPSLVEAIGKGQKTKPDHFPKIITCPNEVSCAQPQGFDMALTS